MVIYYVHMSSSFSIVTFCIDLTKDGQSQNNPPSNQLNHVCCLETQMFFSNRNYFVNM